MGTESGPLTKRFRSSLGSNVQLTECIREFKLPRQYPSMVPKLQNYITTIDKARSQTFTTNASSVPHVSISSKILQSTKVPSTNKVRTVKLKAKDGRDLGEVKVRDLAQNVQGKTINIAENGTKTTSEAVSVIDTTKGITIGVLTPVNIVKSDCFAHEQPKKECNDLVATDKSIAKAVVPSESPKVSMKRSAPGRPQVLVIQSGKSWHMVKIPSNSSTETTNKNTNNCVTVKSQQLINCGKVTISGTQLSKEQHGQNYTSGGNTNGGTDGFIIPAKNICTENNQSHVTMTKWTQLKPPDNTTERCKPKSLLMTENGETARPTIEISRIVAPPGNKSVASLQCAQNCTENCKPAEQSDTFLLKNPHLRQDVMVILPPEKETRDTDDDHSPKNKTKSTKNSDTLKKKSPSLLSTIEPQGTISSARRRKLLVNKNNEGTRYSSTRDLTSSPRRERKDDMANNLIILEKALSSVEDEVLRKKALKALAECGIGMERFIPVRPASTQRSVKDSDTQTSIFGLWDTDQFIHVPKDLPTLERILITKRTLDESPNTQLINPNSQDSFVSGMEWPSRLDKECIELTNMVEGFVRGNDTANQVAAIFAKPCPVRVSIVEQLQNDFDNCKKYDNDGLLDIHKAVIMEQTQAVTRHLMVLQACDESADVPTRDGRTSLELAVSHDVSPEIVKMLLDAGAQPTSMDTGHDSALIIASKKSSPMLMELVRYVKSYRSLNHYDSSGFAALHYCAQNGYQEGVTALIRALANVNLQDRRSGRTALFHAIENEYNDLAEMLLGNSADPVISNYGGQTIFNILDEIKHYNLLEVLNRNGK